MQNNNFEIQEVKEYSQETFEAVRNLAKELDPVFKNISDEEIKEIVNSPSSSLFAAIEKKSGKVVGMVTLLVFRIPFTRKAIFEDFVVDVNYRNLGIGAMLIDKVIESAKEKGALYLDFTSRPKRIEANSLYEKLGFKKRETNSYRLNLKNE